MSAEATIGPGRSLRSEALEAARNAVKLGSSLVLTWGVAIGIRLLLPRHLGPEAFGVFNFADAFTTTLFALMSLGVDTYIRKEVTRRPEHVNDFFFGVLAMRVVGGALLIAIAAGVLHALGRPPEILKILFVFAAAQVLMLTNQTLAALLHSSGKVGGLSISNVVTKALWGVGVVLAVWLQWGIAGIALALVVAEAVKTVVLMELARRHAGLRLTLSAAGTWTVLVACLPLYVNMVAKGLYAKLDVTLLSFAASAEEVGYYGAASNLAGLTLMLTPLLGWVLMPLLSRAAATSPEQMGHTARNALEVILAVAIPSALVIGLGAEYWSRWLFGEAFSPSAGALRLLAPMFVSTYVAIIAASVLIVTDRAWAVTAITVGSVAVNAALNLLLVPVGAKWGIGGAGAGAASAILITEIFVSVALVVCARQALIERGLLSRMLRMFGVGAVTVLLDHELVALGPVRLLIDVSFYVVAVLLTGAVRTREILSFARAAARRKGPTTECPPAAPPSSAPPSSR